MIPPFLPISQTVHMQSYVLSYLVFSLIKQNLLDARVLLHHARTTPRSAPSQDSLLFSTFLTQAEGSGTPLSASTP